ncbi:Secreted protein [Mycena kentingensis (nom. inval.)]|nr:Secreted protein [Mycena kentingensis (nom. inval.)]
MVRRYGSAKVDQQTYIYAQRPQFVQVSPRLPCTGFSRGGRGMPTTPPTNDQQHEATLPSLSPNLAMHLGLHLLILPALAFASIPDWYSRNKNTVQTIYNLTIYPANAAIILGGADAVPPGLFNANASGRAGLPRRRLCRVPAPLAPLPATTPATGPIIVSATLTEFTSGCAEVAASTVHLRIHTIPANGSIPDAQFLTTIKQTAFWHFDDAGAVLHYDAFIPNLDLMASISRGFGDNVDEGVGFYSAAGKQATIGAICGAQAQLCVDGNQVYADVDACVGVLTAKPYGRWDETWGDNVVCRGIHVILAAIRPEVHCAHVGPTGGGKCVETHYNINYFNDVELFGGERAFSCETYW